MNIRTTKRKKNLVAILLITMLLLAGSVIVLRFTDTTEVDASSAEAWLSSSTLVALDEAMSRDYFIHNGTRFHISEYYTNPIFRPSSSERTTVGTTPGILANAYVVVGALYALDPITSLIPLAVFEDLSRGFVGIFSRMGQEWGVIIETFFDNYNTVRHFTVQVVDINTSDCFEADSISNLNYYLVKIKPLFEVGLIWVSTAHPNTFNVRARGHNTSSDSVTIRFTRPQVSGLFAFPNTIRFYTGHFQDWTSRRWSSYFGNARRNFITNFSFAGALANEQNKNPNHVGYNAMDDEGVFFTGTDIHFTAFNKNDLITASRRNVDGISVPEAAIYAFRTFGGYLPVPGLNKALLVWKLIDIVNGLSTPQNFQPTIALQNHGSPFLKAFPLSRVDQLLGSPYPRRLIKNTAFRSSENLALSLKSGVPSYIKGIFRLNQESPVLHQRWISRLETAFSFDIRRYSDGARWPHAVRWQQRNILRADREINPNNINNYREAVVGQTIRVYNNFQNTSRFRFVAPSTGYFRIRSLYTGWHNEPQEIFLNRGEIGYFHLTYLRNHNMASTSEAIIEKVNLTYILEIDNNILRGFRQLSGFDGYITIPWNVQRIADSAFAGEANLRNVRITSSSLLQSIGRLAFAHSSIREITIPFLISFIEPDAFMGTAVTINAEILTPPNWWNSAWRTRWGFTNLNGAQFYLNGLNATLLRYTGNSSNFTVPTNVVLGVLGDRDPGINAPVTSISSFAFENSRIVNIIIPNTVTSIGNNAFAGATNLRTITLERVATIGGVNFNGTSLGTNAFAGLNLSLLNIFVPCWASVEMYRMAHNWNVPTVSARITTNIPPLPPYQLPVGLTAYEGQRLSEVLLPEGWSWVSPNNLVGSAGNRQHTARFVHPNPGFSDIVRTLTVLVSPPPPPPPIWFFTDTLAVTSTQVYIQNHFCPYSYTYVFWEVFQSMSPNDRIQWWIDIFIAHPCDALVILEITSLNYIPLIAFFTAMQATGREVRVILITSSEKEWIAYHHFCTSFWYYIEFYHMRGFSRFLNVAMADIVYWITHYIDAPVTILIDRGLFVLAGGIVDYLTTYLGWFGFDIKIIVLHDIDSLCPSQFFDRPVFILSASNMSNSEWGMCPVLFSFALELYQLGILLDAFIFDPGYWLCCSGVIHSSIGTLFATIIRPCMDPYCCDPYC